MMSKSRGQLTNTTDQGTESDQMTDQEIKIMILTMNSGYPKFKL